MNKLIEKLKNNGLRITGQRKAVLLFLSQQNSSFSIRELYLGLTNEGVKIDEASVYRITDAFKDLGIVHTHRDGRINLCSHQSCSHSFHYTVECSLCHKILEPKLTKLEEKELAKIFKIKSENIKHIQIQSKCEMC